MLEVTKVLDPIARLASAQKKAIDTSIRSFYHAIRRTRAFEDGSIEVGIACLKQWLPDFSQLKRRLTKRSVGAPDSPAPSRPGGFPTFVGWRVGEHQLFVPLASTQQTLVAEAGATENELAARLARACSTRATAWAIVLGNWRGQAMALLWKAANAKPADRYRWVILGGALLVITLSIAGSVAFLSDKRAARSRESPTVSAIDRPDRSNPLAGADASVTPITRTEAVRAAVQHRLSKLISASAVRKREQGALVEYYSIPAKPPLWVDENGLTDRAKSVMEEIAKADDYGLRAIDYELPKPDSFNLNDSTAVDWLVAAEIKITLPSSVTRAMRVAVELSLHA